MACQRCRGPLPERKRGRPRKFCERCAIPAQRDGDREQKRRRLATTALDLTIGLVADGEHEYLNRPYVEAIRRDPCTYCGGRTTDLDHIDPSEGERDANGRRKYTAGREWSNLTAACRLCNVRKGNKPLLDALLSFRAK